MEELTSQRVEQLESLVTEYQATIAEMEKKIEDLGGDPSTIEGGRPRKELLDELAAAKSGRDEAQQGALLCHCLTLSVAADKERT